MATYCPLCMSRDRTREFDMSDPDRPRWRCDDESHGAQGFVWVAATEGTSGTRRRASDTSGGSGSAVSEFGEKLVACIPTGEAFVSYGFVEDRFFELWPEDAGLLLDRYGHVWRGGAERSGGYTMSMYLAHRLSELERAGLVEHVEGEPDERWPHLSTISHWRLSQ